MNKLYLARGELTVKAKGYWFTSGGEKGAFGYFPHLKDMDGYPVYPDTQIHGDLRMAATWLNQLNGQSDEALINEVFGKSGRDSASLLKVTDLELAEEFKNPEPQTIYKVKARIDMDEATRTSAENMLVNLELAYLNKYDLKASLYLGYFDNEARLNQARELVCSTARLLSGFGAFRSRGYGRGAIEVHWRPTLPLEYANDYGANSGSSFMYFLHALTHFRNKPIEPGRTQLTESIHAVTSSQLRGWFVRTYQKLFGQWPDIKKLNSIQFPNCYPSDFENRQLGFFPPFTTQKFAHDTSIKDVYQTDANKKDGQEQNDNENYIRQKNKPLPANEFVTTEPSVFSMHSERRIRNAINLNFTTIEDGLFVQELIHCGMTFGCRIQMESTDRDFAKKARFIFDKVYPVINGCIFEPSTVDAPINEITSQPCLVILPLPYEPKHKQNSNRIMLTSQRRYNTMLQRPRRNRIVIAPGSVITSSEPSIYLMPWNGFGKTIKPGEPDKTAEIHKDKIKPKAFPEVKTPIFPGEFLKVSRSQAGFLREFLNPKRSTEQMKSVIEVRLQKYPKDEDKEGNLIPKELFKKLLEYLNNDDRDGMRKYIEELMEALFLTWWEDKKEEVNTNFEKEKNYE